MSKGFKIFVFSILGIIVVAIIYVLVTGNKPAGPKKEKKPNQNPPPNNNNNNSNTTTETDASKAGIDPSANTVEAIKANIPILKKVYAGEDILNLYKDCQPSQSNIWGTFNTGDYLGEFISKEGSCIKLAADNYLFGYIKTGTTTVYLPFNAKIVYK